MANNTIKDTNIGLFPNPVGAKMAKTNSAMPNSINNIVKAILKPSLMPPPYVKHNANTVHTIVPLVSHRLNLS